MMTVLLPKAMTDTDLVNHRLTCGVSLLWEQGTHSWAAAPTGMAEQGQNPWLCRTQPPGQGMGCQQHPAHRMHPPHCPTYTSPALIKTTTTSASTKLFIQEAIVNALMDAACGKRTVLVGQLQG
jgi:hypothetical protein